MGETSRENSRVVLRHGGTCSKSALKDCELASKRRQQLYKVSTPCLDDRCFKKEELESVETDGEFSNACSQIVLKCLSLVRIGKLDILWRLSIVDWISSKTLILLETVKTLNQPREESYVFPEVEHLFLRSKFLSIRSSKRRNGIYWKIV